MKKTSHTLFNEQAIQAFIDAIINEENTNPLYNTFIQPFVDVGTTAAYGIERLSAQVQTVVMGFFLGIPTLLVPFLEYDYEKFREEESQRVEEIKKKYEKVFKANFEALSSNDAFGVAFLLAPTKVLAAQLAVKAPATAIKVLDILTGAIHPPLSDMGKALAEPASIGFHDPGGHAAGAWAGGYGGGGGDWGGGDGFYENKNPADGNKQLSSQVQNVLKDKKTINAIRKSPIAKQMRQDGVKIIVDHIKRFMSLTDYNQMRKMSPNDAGFSQIGQKLSGLNQAGQIPPQDNAVVTNAMVPEIKKAYKEFWVKQLQQLTKQFPEANEEIIAGIKQVEALS